MAKVTAADGHVYDKSSTANATVAPTNAATIANAANVTGLTAEQADFVTLVDMEWHLTGSFPRDKFLNTYSYSKKELNQLTGNPLVQQNLLSRGIKPQAYLKADAEPIKDIRAPLTPIQLAAANTLLDLTDTRSQRKKLQDLGVSSRQYQAWLKDANFQGYLRERSEGLIGDIQHEAMLALADRVIGGDLKAIEYYHELTGRFVKQRNTPSAVNGPAAVGADQAQQLVVRIIEIVLEEADGDTAMRISDRLKNLISGQQVANSLFAPDPIVVPEVAPARELTPELENLTKKGLGYDT